MVQYALYHPSLTIIFEMMCPSIWVDLPVIGSLVAMSYYTTLSQTPNDCGMMSFFVTSITIILVFMCIIAENFVIKLLQTRTDTNTPTDSIDVFVIDAKKDDEPDGTPLPPESTSGIRVDTDQVQYTILHYIPCHLSESMTEYCTYTGILHLADLGQCVWHGIRIILYDIQHTIFQHSRQCRNVRYVPCHQLSRIHSRRRH